ncbi:hypothetical protein Tco_1067636 [Tanacetum coccineum]|uniref:Reverse transcriptase domain-containing protein n=1 Tax=Tanacetum coccineum TaxID=301880 RepID=A0ABQ5HEP6_9ASTR
MYIPYITISSDSQDAGTGSSIFVFAPASPAHVPTSHAYAPSLDDDTELLEVLASRDIALGSDAKTEPDPSEEDEPLAAKATPTPPTQTPPTILTPKTRYTLPSSIEAAISNYVVAPPYERYRSPSPSASTSPSADHRHYHHHQQYHHYHHLLCRHLCKRFRWSSPPQQDTTVETTIEPITHAPRLSSTAAHILLVTGEPIHHTIPLLVARLVRHEGRIKEIHDHLEEIPLERVETVEQELENSGNGTHHEASGSARAVEHTVRGCSYKESFNCNPCNFNGTEGAVGLTRWFDKMESVFCISNRADVYYMHLAGWNELQKMETELWNLTVKGTDIVRYTKRFQELALLCLGMVSLEDKKIERSKAVPSSKANKGIPEVTLDGSFTAMNGLS